MSEPKEKSPAANEAQLNVVDMLAQEYAIHPLYSKPKDTRLGTKSYLLLEALVEAEGHEVSLRNLMLHTHLGAVHSAAATLRDKGWDIRNRIDRDSHHSDEILGTVFSWYRVVIPTAPDATA